MSVSGNINGRLEKAEARAARAAKALEDAKRAAEEAANPEAQEKAAARANLKKRLGELNRLSALNTKATITLTEKYEKEMEERAANALAWDEERNAIKAALEE